MVAGSAMNKSAFHKGSLASQRAALLWWLDLRLLDGHLAYRS